MFSYVGTVPAAVSQVVRRHMRTRLYFHRGGGILVSMLLCQAFLLFSSSSLPPLPPPPPPEKPDAQATRIKAYFPRLTHKSGRVLLKKTSFHFGLVLYYFFAPYNNRKSFQVSTIRTSKAFKGRRNIVVHFRQRSEVFGKSSEIFVSGSDVFGNIPVMTRQKSYAFDSEKVGHTGFKFAPE